MKFTSKSEYVYKYIHQKIAHGQFTPGILYKIVDIAAELGMSRTPVSEAIKLLVSRNIIVLHPSVGFEVRSLPKEEIEEIFILRRELEKFAITRAIELGISKVDMDELKTLIQQSREAVKNQEAEKYADLNVEFHDTLYSLAKMPRLSLIMEDLWLYESWSIHAFKRDPDSVLCLINGHAKILEFIEDKKDLQSIMAVVAKHSTDCMNIISQEFELSGEKNR